MSKTDQIHLDPEAIAKRAFEIWERDGRPDGQSDAHWMQAINELTQERAAAKPDAPYGSATRSTTRSKSGAAKGAENSTTAAGPKTSAAPKSKAKAKSETTTKRKVSKKKS